jgi:threonine synthase
MTEIICTNCRRPYPAEGAPYRCVTCGGVYDYATAPIFDVKQIEPDLPGIWRYRNTFGLAGDAPVISLEEGNTPLVWAQVFDRQIAFKLEYENPTGAFKDRGSAVLVGFLLGRGVDAAVEDSSGNAGASFAAYAAHAGLQARIFIPDSTSGPKRAQIEASGAEVVRILGRRSNAAAAVQRAAEEGAVYASHAYLPQGLRGYATLAYELVEQMETPPGTVIAPVGQGNLLLAVGRGFHALHTAGIISKTPLLVGVQALACAPIWAVHKYGAAGLGWVTEGETLAEGVRIRQPLRGDAVLRIVEAGGGFFVAVDEQDILPGRDQLAKFGFSVEPTSAIVWSALKQVVGQVPEPIVVVLTGAGFKSDI